MRSVIVVLAAIVLILQTAARTEAVEPVYGSTKVGGVFMNCTDFRGRPVQTYVTSGLGDAGRSIIMGRVPVISLDSEIMSSLSDKMQIFFYLHECAHHALAHMFYPAPEAESDADCWSIRWGRDRAYFSRADIEAFGPRLSLSPGTRHGHLPGPARLAHLLKCFDGE